MFKLTSKVTDPLPRSDWPDANEVHFILRCESQFFTKLEERPPLDYGYHVVNISNTQLVCCMAFFQSKGGESEDESLQPGQIELYCDAPTFLQRLPRYKKK